MKKEKGSVLEPHFTDEDKAREYLEQMRWPDGVVCPHCGLVGEAYCINVKGKTPEEVEAMKGAGRRVRKPRKGLWKCAGCRGQFTVTVRSIFEDTHIPLHKWLLAIHLLLSSKKGMSAHQLMRSLGIKQYRSARLMAHRIRYALTGERPEKMSGIVEVGGAYVGGKRRNRQAHPVKPGQRAQDHPGSSEDEAAAVTVLEREGKVRSRHAENVTAENFQAASTKCARKTRTS